ncbi:thiol reductant ABC exporter subunit CydD [Plantibacter sp. YIM 135347]|uniref:thiol reductant ABC exporter subunit CydD n=1 Tax=Plantibacter sp. YIM 135347 TaxID=3423919 RepID=UPI003D326D2C
MRPLDPRLLRYAGAARFVFAAGAVLALVQTLCILGFAWLVSQLVTRAIAGDPFASLVPELWLLVAVVVLRATVIFATETVNARGSALVRSQLRRAVVGAVTVLGPSWMSQRSSAEVTTIAGRGLDALDPYFGRYVPQLILTAIATPIIVLVIFLQDVVSGITVLVTLPIIPVFMVLIGLATQSLQRKQWETLGDLSKGFLDLVGGMATLKVFGRQHRQVRRIRQVTEDYRAQTMKVLRVSFMSGFALELASSLAVAVVAVGIGIRLIDGSMLLAVGLFVLILAPEAFLPLRNVGTNFHAASEGVTAAEDAFVILDAAAAFEGSAEAGADDRTGDGAAGGRGAAAPADREPARMHVSVGGPLVFDDVSVRYGDRIAVDRFSATFLPGTVTAITGPSGAGKSSLLGALLGFVPADGVSGEIRYAGHVLDGGAMERPFVAWAGQRAALIGGTVLENVALGDPEPSSKLARAALDRIGLSAIDVEDRIGVVGDGLSGGQAQRVAIARALYRLGRRAVGGAAPGVLVLDEPSSALDTRSESVVIDAVRAAASGGAIVIVVSHRTAFVTAGDREIRLDPPKGVPLTPEFTHGMEAATHG